MSARGWLSCSTACCIIMLGIGNNAISMLCHRWLILLQLLHLGEKDEESVRAQLEVQRVMQRQGRRSTHEASGGVGS